MSRPAVQFYHVAAPGADSGDGAQGTTPEAFCELLHEHSHGDVAAHLARARQGESVVSLELKRDGVTCLLVMQPHESGAGVSVLLIPLDNLLVPDVIAERALGMRKQVIHDICNDLTAARLSSELAGQVLGRSGVDVDSLVTDALDVMVSVSESIEHRLRTLQSGVKLDFTGAANDPVSAEGGG